MKKNKFDRLVIMGIIFCLGFGTFIFGCGRQSNTSPTLATGLTILTVTPTNGATGIELYANITATFSTTMDSATTATTDAFTLTTSTGTKILGAVGLNANKTILTFLPSSHLAYSTTYLATIAATVRDSSGNAMSLPKTWRFTTVASPSASSLWDVSVVDSTGDVGEYSSIVVNNGRIHISYHDATTYGQEGLKYATKTNNSSSWDIETVDSGGLIGKYTSIFLDSNDKVHISYFDQTNGNLKYATNVSGSWVKETVDTGGYVGLYTSIAIDSADNPHICYLKDTDTFGIKELKYAKKTNNAWASETVASNLNGYAGTSIRVGTDNIVQIIYQNGTKVMYAKGTPGSWTTEEISAGVSTGTNGLILYNNTPYIAFNGIIGLAYADRTQNKWTVENTGISGSDLSYVFDSNGNPNIAYYDSNGNLSCAVKGASSWTATVIDPNLTVGQYNSSDYDGKMYVSYYDRENFDLKIAVQK